MKLHTPAFGVAINKIHGINNEENGLKGENYFLFSSLFFLKKGTDGNEIYQKEAPAGYRRQGYFSPIPYFYEEASIHWDDEVKKKL